MVETEKRLSIPVDRSEKIRVSYVAIASVGANPRPQLDATTPENVLSDSNKKSMNVMTY